MSLRSIGLDQSLVRRTWSRGNDGQSHAGGNNERVRDASFLHNLCLVAVAQTNHVYISDDAGAEIHKLIDHQDHFVMTYLPHPWLLSTLGRAGWLKYHVNAVHIPRVYCLPVAGYAQVQE